jgi:hypothetical protein
MERTIFPLVGRFNQSGFLLDIWDSGFISIVKPTDPDYFYLQSFCVTPPDMRSDEDLMLSFNQSAGQVEDFISTLTPYEYERFQTILDEIYERAQI